MFYAHTHTLQRDVSRVTMQTDVEAGFMIRLDLADVFVFVVFFFLTLFASVYSEIASVF